MLLKRVQEVVCFIKNRQSYLIACLCAITFDLSIPKYGKGIIVNIAYYLSTLLILRLINGKLILQIQSCLQYMVVIIPLIIEWSQICNTVHFMCTQYAEAFINSTQSLSLTLQKSLGTYKLTNNKQQFNKHYTFNCLNIMEAIFRYIRSRKT